MVKKRILIEDFKDCIRIEREILEDYVFFVMEYLSGGELAEFMNSRAPFDVCTTRFLAAEILCGLQFLHARGIIHRDIKPDNILLDSAGHAKITDFGLVVTNVLGNKKIKEFAGTPGYMAPESPVMDINESIAVNDMLSSTEMQKPPISPEDEKLFCGFSFE